jgi:UDP-N-acetylmuramoyl-tripeptide--D-alanyl-D-alanine ligase
MKLDDFIRIIQGVSLGTPDGQAAIAGAAVHPGDAGPEKVFFTFCQLDYSSNCFNGSFPDAPDKGIVPRLLARGTEFCVMRRENYQRNSDWLDTYRDHIIVVDDAIVALQRLAHAALANQPLPVIGITGSAGKTTTKELIAHILSSRGCRVLYTPGNQNNGIGLPLTVQKLLSSARFDTAVLEMGMSTRDDEIARLCRIAAPDVAVVLNVLPVHIEHMLTLDAVEQAKAQIVEGMRHDGIAVLNADDPRVFGMRRKAGRSLTFGLSTNADVRGSNLRFDREHTAFTLHYRNQSVEVISASRGVHNVMNMLAASAACLAHDAKIDLYAIAGPLGTFTIPAQRGREVLLKNGVVLIDDTYNSNPHSLLLAVEAARALVATGGRLVVVAGGMHELGPASYPLHVEAGAAIADAGADILFSVGKDANGLIEGFHQACDRIGRAHENLASLLAAVENAFEPGDVLLIKGSRAENLEILVQQLCREHAIDMAGGTA